jgi:hypothetical protein
MKWGLNLMAINKKKRRSFGAIRKLASGKYQAK